MSHIRLQCKLSILPVVGDAFLLQFLSTQNHSMRKFKQKQKKQKQMWVTESLRCAKQSSRQPVPDDCREGTFRLDPSRRVTGILAAFAWRRWRVAGGALHTEDISAHPVPPPPYTPPAVSASSNRAGLPRQDGTRPVLTTTIKARWLALPPLPRDSLLRFSHRHTGLASNRAFLCTDKKVRQSCLETIQDNQNCDKVDLRETSAFEAA